MNELDRLIEAWRGNVRIADEAGLLLDIYTKSGSDYARRQIPGLRARYLEAVKWASVYRDRGERAGIKFGDKGAW